MSQRMFLFVIWASGAIAHCYLFISQVKRDKDMEKEIPGMGLLPPTIVNSIIVFSVGLVSFFWPGFMLVKLYQATKKLFKKDSV